MIKAEQASGRRGYLSARKDHAQRASYCYPQGEPERSAVQASDAERESAQAFQVAFQGNVVTKIRVIAAVLRATYKGAQKAYRAGRTEGKVPEFDKSG